MNGLKYCRTEIFDVDTHIHTQRIGLISTTGILYSQKGQCLNYLSWVFIDILSNVRHFNHLKRFKQPHLLNDRNGRDRLVVKILQDPSTTIRTMAVHSVLSNLVVPIEMPHA